MIVNAPFLVDLGGRYIMRFGAVPSSAVTAESECRGRDGAVDSVPIGLTCALRAFRVGRVEYGRGRLGHAATRRFPSPLVEPDVPISGIRLSDWLHREAHNGTVRGRRSRRSRPSSP